MKQKKALQKVIEHLHDCKAKWVESVPVKETFRGQTVWDGVVEVFTITGHPKAKRCYAWAHLEGEKDEMTNFVTVLEIPPVNSALAAVRVAIVASGKAKRRKP